MEEIRREGEQVVVRLSLEQLRLLLGTLNESINGAYALPADEWGPLVGQPIERAEMLMDAISEML